MENKALHRATKGFASAQYICCMDSGNHIGEYIKDKILNDGRQLSWFAEKMNMSRQNVSKSIFDKNELVPSKIKEIERVLGSGFFDEFLEKNRLSKYYDLSEDGSDSVVSEPSAKYGGGYSLSIQVDPDNFDAEEMHRLVDIMDEVTRKMKG